MCAAGGLSHRLVALFISTNGDSYSADKMRLTSVVRGFQHSRMYFFDKKWDRLHERRKVNPGWFKVWRRKWYVERKREVKQLPAEIPENSVVIDAAKMMSEEHKTVNYTLPEVWPYTKEYTQKYEEGEISKLFYP